MILGLVPRSVVEFARTRHLLVPLLRHRSLRDLQSFTVLGGPPVTLVAVDSLLTRMLYWYGGRGYEADEVQWWHRFCAQAEGILEIGANIGYYTVVGALAAPGVPYTAVEAHPGTADILRRNLAANAVDHVRVLQGAVLGRPSTETIELALPDLEQYVAPTGAFVNANAEGVGARRAAKRTISVPTIASGDLVDGVDLVKLDIEGAEYDVLHGIVDGLVRRRVIVLIEVLRDTPALRSLLLAMEREDYGFWLVSGPTLRPVPARAVESQDIFAEFGSRDIAVIPNERRRLFD